MANKKKMTQWLIEHREKSNCNSWFWHNGHWGEGGCDKKYLCEIYQYGICYLHHKKFNHKKECFIKERYNKCNFMTYLKTPLRII